MLTLSIGLRKMVHFALFIRDKHKLELCDQEVETIRGRVGKVLIIKVAV